MRLHEYIKIRDKIAADYDKRIDLLLNEIEILMHQKDAALAAADAFSPYIQG